MDEIFSLYSFRLDLKNGPTQSFAVIQLFACGAFFIQDGASLQLVSKHLTTVIKKSAGGLCAYLPTVDITSAELWISTQGENFDCFSFIRTPEYVNISSF